MPQILCTFEINLECTFARRKKYSSKLDISCSLIRKSEVNLECTSLAVKNIQVNLIFLARLFVHLNHICQQIKNNAQGTWI